MTIMFEIRDKDTGQYRFIDKIVSSDVVKGWERKYLRTPNGRLCSDVSYLIYVASVRWRFLNDEEKNWLLANTKDRVFQARFFDKETNQTEEALFFCSSSPQIGKLYDIRRRMWDSFSITAEETTGRQ